MAKQFDDDNDKTMDAEEFFKRQKIKDNIMDKETSIYFEDDKKRKPNDIDDLPTQIKSRRVGNSLKDDNDAPTVVGNLQHHRKIEDEVYDRTKIKGNERDIKRGRTYDDDDYKTVVVAETKVVKQKNYAFLVLINTNRAGKFYPIEKEEIIIGGVISKCDIALTCTKETISKTHAKIYSEGIEYFIYDMDSSNGTYVNGETVGNKIREARQLQDGDRIRFGKELELVFKKVF